MGGGPSVLKLEAWLPVALRGATAVGLLALALACRPATGSAAPEGAVRPGPESAGWQGCTPAGAGEPMPNLSVYPGTGTVYDVRVHGAAGNGVHDDTAALQSLLDSASPGATVLFPEGNYRISATLTIPRALRLVGRGARITQVAAAASGIDTAPDAADVVIDGLELAGSSTDRTTDRFGIRIRRRSVVRCSEVSGFNWGIAMGGTADAERAFAVGNHVHDLAGTRSGQGYGIILTAPRSVVRGNLITNAWRHAIYVTANPLRSSAESEVVGNTIAISESPVPAAGMIEVYALASEPAITGVGIVGNTILGGPGAVNDGIRLDGNVGGIAIIGNVVSGTERMAVGVVGDKDRAPDRVRIVGNALTPARGHHLYLSPNLPGPSPANITARLERGARVSVHRSVTSLAASRGEGRVVLPLAARVETDASRGDYFEIRDDAAGTTREIADPTNPVDGQVITYAIWNLGGGGLGAYAFGGEFRLAGPWNQPGNGRRRLITFRRQGGFWVEVSRTSESAVPSAR
jgi:hypothetical protein